MAAKGETDLSLLVKYWGYEWSNTKFDIYIDDEKLISENNNGRWYQSKFEDAEYKIPNSMISGKKNIRIKFQAQQNGIANPVYPIRLIRKSE